MDPQDRKTRRLKRQESVTGRSIRPCDNFKPNVWRPNKCVHCFFTAAQHGADASTSAPQISDNDLKRLKDLLDSGVIQEAEFERRKAELLNLPGMWSYLHYFSLFFHSLSDLTPF